MLVQERVNGYGGDVQNGLYIFALHLKLIKISV